MSDPADIARIGYVIANCDEIVYNDKVSYGFLDEKGKPSPVIEIKKRINGIFYAIQAVSESKSRKNHIITAYIEKSNVSEP